jgi:hypothetical protein
MVRISNSEDVHESRSETSDGGSERPARMMGSEALGGDREGEVLTTIVGE